MRDVIPEIEKRGAKLIVVGNGQVQHARVFQEDHPVAATLLVDPRLRAYRAAGLRRDVSSTVNLRTLVHGARALREGHRQGRTQGDPWQQGGVLIVTPDDRVLFHQVSQEAGDHVAPDDILAAIPEASE